MTIQTVETQETEPYAAPLAAGVAVNSAPVPQAIPETRTFRDFRSRYLSVRWVVPCLTRGLAMGTFMLLGHRWLIDKGIPSTETGQNVCVVLLFILSHFSSEAAGRGFSKLIRLKEFDE